MLLTLLLTSCDYQPDTLPVDSDDYPQQVTLSGHVILASGHDAPGTPHVVLYDAARPPPPAGLGSPLNLAIAGEWGALESADTGLPGQGVASAAWSMTGVSSGTYLLSALVDNDGDFNPFPGISDYAGGATCGDQLGAYLYTSADSSPLPFTVQAPDRIDNVDILVSSPLPFERPAFVLHEDEVVLDHSIAPDPADLLGTLQVFTLKSTGIDAPLLTLNPPDAAECPTRFTILVRDADGDGVADPYPLSAEVAALGAVDMFPQVLLTYISDLDGNVPEEGSFVAPLIPSPFALGDYTPNVPFTTDTLPVVFLGAALAVDANGNVDRSTLLEGDDFPTGIWGLAVLNHTGQIWLTPNSLAGVIEGQDLTIRIE